MEEIYDLLILGGGPGAMTAGIYAKRAGLKVAIIEKSVPGGAVTTTYEVANYPGFIKISGMDLANKMFEHTSQVGVEFIWDEVSKVFPEGEEKTVECYSGKKYTAKTIIIGFGASVRKLNLENERAFIGKGISYCATCDGALFKDREVAVFGGGNTALEDCYYLSNIAKKVYLIHRRDEFRGDDILVKQVKSKDNIELVLNSIVTKLNGEKTLTEIEVTNKITQEIKTLKVDCLFVCIGRGPDTEMISGKLNLSQNGYIITDECMRTNYDGVFAIGDIRETPLRQIVTACSDGAIAATKAYEYLKNLRLKNQEKK